MAHVETLHLRAAVVGQQAQLFFGFHALGRHPHPQATAQLDQGADDGVIFDGLADAGDSCCRS